MIHAAVLSGFAGSLAAPWLHRLNRALSGWMIALLPAALTVYFAGYIPLIAQGQTLSASLEWVPSLGISFSFYLDGLSLLFALLISGIGALVIIYSAAYLNGHNELGRLYAFLLLFMASMLGLVLADNAITLFVFWELTSFSSYLLIGFDHDREEARAAAQQALIVTSAGGLALLVGFLLLGQAANSLDLSVMAAQANVIRGHLVYTPALLLILLGAFAKSAQFPFHFWLPAAMEAPTPVSAYLHSATMVKAGVYLLARLNPIMGDTDTWRVIVSVVGLITMLTGAYLALFQVDSKRILAYATVSALGTLVLLLGIETRAAIEAAIVFLLAHVLYKAALFLLSGAITHETGTRNVEIQSGLWRVMPITAIISILAAFSLAGLGPVLSFIGKEMLFEALLASPQWAILFVAAGVVLGAVFIALALILTARPLFGPPGIAVEHAHEAPFGLLLGPAVLSILSILLGLFPGWLSGNVISPAVGAVLGEPHVLSLSLWHGINPALGLSVASLLIGLVLYRFWAAFRRTASPIRVPLGETPQRAYNLAMDVLNRVAVAQTRLLQSGYLRYYLLIILVTAISLSAYPLFRNAAFSWPSKPFDARYYELAIAALIISATVAAVRAQSRLAAVAALGVVGYGISLVFIMFGAPDVAVTQFMVESLVVILLVLVFYHLPRFSLLSTPRARRWEFAVSLAAGSLMTVLVLSVTGVQFHPSISSYFIEQSVPLAHGRNVVNTILVDFRAFDTLGEITVLALAAVGVFALLRLRIARGGRR